MGFETNVDDGVRLECPCMEASDTQLDLSYVLTNDGPAPIFVANGLFHRRGAAGFEVDTNLVYAELSDDSVLRICKQVIEVPEGVSVEAPEVPYFTRVDSGSELSERLRLALPIGPRHPYRRQPRSDALTTVKRVTFTVGYVTAEDGLEPKEMTLSGGDRYWWMSYSDVIRRQRLKECGPFDVEVSVAAGT